MLSFHEDSEKQTAFRLSSTGNCKLLDKAVPVYKEQYTSHRALDRNQEYASHHAKDKLDQSRWGEKSGVYQHVLAKFRRRGTHAMHCTMPKVSPQSARACCTN